jgi:hypothetical protein
MEITTSAMAIPVNPARRKSQPSRAFLFKKLKTPINDNIPDMTNKDKIMIYTILTRK